MTAARRPSGRARDSNHDNEPTAHGGKRGAADHHLFKSRSESRVQRVIIAAMLQFVLTLNIEPDVSRKDLSLALRRLAASIEKTNDPIDEGDAAPIRSSDGDLIGEWEIRS